MTTTQKLRLKKINTELISKICLIMLMAFFIMSLYETGAHSNPAKLEGTYQTVYVSQGDCLWTIAAKHVNDKEDIRLMISTIRQLNQLDANAQIQPGQELKIPVKGSSLMTRGLPLHNL